MLEPEAINSTRHPREILLSAFPLLDIAYATPFLRAQPILLADNENADVGLPSPTLDIVKMSIMNRSHH